MCSFLGVSKKAFMIRMEEANMIDDNPYEGCIRMVTILYREVFCMARSVVLNPLYIAMIKKEDDKIAAEMAKYPVKAIKCRYCNHQTEKEAEGIKGTILSNANDADKYLTTGMTTARCEDTECNHTDSFSCYRYN